MSWAKPRRTMALADELALFFFDGVAEPMSTGITTAILCALTACSVATAADEGGWWNPDWHFRTTVGRSPPWRDDAPRPVEVAVDFPLLLQRGGIAGQFDPGSLRVVEQADDGSGREVPFACRPENTPQRGASRAI